MPRSTNEQKLVNDLREEIMDELGGEDVAIQIKVAFAVLVAVIGDGVKREPDEVRRSLAELQELMALVQ